MRRNGPVATDHHDASRDFLGVGKNVARGTPHSPPLSSPPYTSPGTPRGRHVSGGASNSWFPGLVRNGTRPANGAICSLQSSHTDAYPVAYDKSPNKNAASTSPRAASRANARDTFHAGAPYSCHVTESSSVPRPMSANIANEKGRYEDDRFEDARSVDKEDRPVFFAVSSVSRSSPRGTASHASGASTAGNLPPASSKSSYATVRPGGAPTILATCVYPGCLHPTPSAGEPHRSSRANVVVVAGDSTASSGEPGSHHRRRGVWVASRPLFHATARFEDADATTGRVASSSSKRSSRSRSRRVGAGGSGARTTTRGFLGPSASGTETRGDRATATASRSRSCRHPCRVTQSSANRTTSWSARAHTRRTRTTATPAVRYAGSASWRMTYRVGAVAVTLARAGEYTAIQWDALGAGEVTVTRATSPHRKEVPSSGATSTDQPGTDQAPSGRWTPSAVATTRREGSTALRGW